MSLKIKQLLNINLNQTHVISNKNKKFRNEFGMTNVVIKTKLVKLNSFNFVQFASSCQLLFRFRNEFGMTKRNDKSTKIKNSEI